MTIAMLCMCMGMDIIMIMITRKLDINKIMAMMRSTTKTLTSTSPTRMAIRAHDKRRSKTSTYAVPTFMHSETRSKALE
ncbi:hypothetical protein HPP92_023743 [Vanilla planifolia]|uniref:Uncharacterized protein n=1 Tax=Vanilla planifolia TaxID=51239 RepID=A0A835PQW0_VANPL|nr:hypothetical protein HPP92_023743 [Vanilla planifolia]